MLAWRVSNTLETEACVEALEEALGYYGAPEIFNGEIHQRGVHRGTQSSERTDSGWMGKDGGSIMSLLNGSGGA